MDASQLRESRVSAVPLAVAARDTGAEGGTVSTITRNSVGVGSTFPAPSTARTKKLVSPSGSPVSSWDPSEIEK